ncbi:TetR/AcrR family transcriptional regulator [Lapillicoccus jejuensis]|uniref:TetR family transcriptional regulator n=1 Tax=Lapillicoccus jejuensis TaxID=402171 RepID=A0A542E4I5_9MICO|nr:TetR/AcrR family transcriptional regulator [Lapillicoccus jejuensis]TQJ10186.1 TetR family transcriptional regulator [Lapillicoccus jejuensis]
MTADGRTGRGPGRPRGSRSGATREAVVRAAFAAFAEGGFRGTSVAQVGERVGLSAAGVLHHVGSKEALLAEVLRLRGREDAAVAAADEAVGFAVLDRLEHVVALNTTRPGLIRLYVTLSAEAVDPEHPAHDWLLEHLEAVREAVSGALRRGVAAGTVRPGTPVDTVAQLVVAVLDGLQVQWVADPGSIDMVRAARTAFAALRAPYELS